MKKLLALLLAAIMVLSVCPVAFAEDAPDDGAPAPGSPPTLAEQQKAAELLAFNNLMNGTGYDEDGNPIFNLEAPLSRVDATVMLVRLLGKVNEANAFTGTAPFTDEIPNYGKKAVAYAYSQKLVKGVSTTRFDAKSLVTPAQFCTMVLRAMGYKDGEDFNWRTAWKKTDELGISQGINETASTFTRGYMAVISVAALETPVKDSEQTLAHVAGIILREPEPTETPDPTATPDPSEKPSETPDPTETPEPTPEPSTPVINHIQGIATELEKNGTKDDDGNYYETAQLPNITVEIGYVPAEHEVYFSIIQNHEEDDEKYTYSSIMSFHTSGNLKTAPPVIWEYENGTKSTTVVPVKMVMSEYAKDTKLELKYADNESAVDAEATEIYNAILQDFMAYWDSVLNYFYEIGLADLGFTSYK